VSQLRAQSIHQLCVGTNKPLIVPYSEDRLVINGKSAGLSAASYDCRIDHDLVLGINPAFIIANHILAGKPLVEVASGMCDPELAELLANNPSMTSLAFTVEDFWFSDSVTGAVCDKSTYARMFVSAFNTFFDPGFHGNATLELVNHGPKPVTYKEGDPVCQFLFNHLDGPTDRPYDGKFQHQTKKAHGPRLENADGTWTEDPAAHPAPVKPSPAQLDDTIRPWGRDD
jgi:dCTP deaminase